jgi:HPt (histidine-containing phosphotransfer) domain-containing protein
MNPTSHKPTSVPAIPETVTLDCDHILNRAGGDPELLVQLCTVFLEEIPVRIAAVEAALGKGAGVERALQQLRNSLMILGPGQLSYTADTLNRAFLDGRKRVVRSEWRRLRRELSCLVPQIHRLMLEVSTPRSPVQ